MFRFFYYNINVWQKIKQKKILSKILKQTVQKKYSEKIVRCDIKLNTLKDKNDK